MASDTKKKGNTTKAKDEAKKKATVSKKSTKNTAAVKANASKSTAASSAKKATSKTNSTKKKPSAAKSNVKTDVVKVPAKKVSTSKGSTKKDAKKSSATKSSTNKPVSKKKTTTESPVKISKKEETVGKTVDVKKEIIKKPIEKDELALISTQEIKVEEVVKTEKENDDELFANTILGLELPVGDNDDKKKRLGNYARDALIFAVVIPILDLFAMVFIDSYKAYPITNNELINYGLTLLIDFVMIFVLTYIIDYIHGENTVKRMKK